MPSTRVDNNNSKTTKQLSNEQRLAISREKARAWAQQQTLIKTPTKEVVPNKTIKTINEEDYLGNEELKLSPTKKERLAKARAKSRAWAENRISPKKEVYTSETLEDIDTIEEEEKYDGIENKNYEKSSINLLLIVPIIIILTCIKLLLIPSYHSTDFHVHRNWLSLTHKLPISEWYFNNINNTTVHTLDYPPSFAYFEYILSNNILTTKLLQYGYLDEECLYLLGDEDNTTPSFECIMFQRCTVILSDFIFIIGSYIASSSISATSNTKLILFLLLICNPGILLLDHVHFQYNGMLLGILLSSIGYLLQDRYLLCAMLYSILLTMKHLYLVLGLVYFIFLLRWYCCFDGTNKITFSIKKFLTLGLLTLSTLLLPFLPFIHHQMNSNDGYKEQLKQILKRLFPFERGLCHDYWAGNVWAIYLFVLKCLRLFKIDVLREDSISPFGTSVAMVCSFIPGLITLWKGGGDGVICKNKLKLVFIHVMVYTSFSSFMLAYHVHEKAIMTTIIPLTLLVPISKQYARLYLRTNLFGIFGLSPLLYRVVELPFKTCIYFLYLFVLVYVLQHHIKYKDKKGQVITMLDNVCIGIICCVMIFMEIVHPFYIYPKMEFLPLMITSLTVACGLIFCWIHSAFLMFHF